jgi:hypothetical protein
MPGYRHAAGHFLGAVATASEVGLIVAIVVFVAVFAEMVHRAAVALLKRVAILMDHFALHRRMTVGRVIVRIFVAPIVEIVPRGLNAITESLALGIAILGRRLVPAPLSLILWL